MSLFIFLQHIAPQHLLSRIMGTLADTRQTWLKNFFIQKFIKRYHIDLSEAIIKNPADYPSFNDFFTRQLDMQFRPEAEGNNTILSPVDGIISQIGFIQDKQLIQAKGYEFSLEELLGRDNCAEQFANGTFATLYLAPRHYHRVHMPLGGRLIKTIYIPGKLFSVNPATTHAIPNLFGQNERLVCLFETKAGLMAVILVGAMIVGSIQTVWMEQPVRESEPGVRAFPNGIQLEKGAELGCFKMGSTVIVLFLKDSTTWNPALQFGNEIRVRQQLGMTNR